MADETKAEKKTALDIINEVQALTIKLGHLPTVINLLMEHLELAMAEPSPEAEYLYRNSRAAIYNILSLCEAEISEVTEKINGLTVKK